MNYIGVDVSAAELVVAHRTEKKAFVINRYNNDTKGIKRFLQALNPSSDALILEATGTYSLQLTYTLVEEGFLLSVLNPKQSSCFKKGVLLSNDKTDAADAQALVQYGECMKPSAFQPKTKEWHHLRQLFGLQEWLKTQHTALKNKLHALSREVYPNTLVQELLQQKLAQVQQELKAVEQKLCTVCEQEFNNLLKLGQTVKGIGPKIMRALLIITDGLKKFDNTKQLAKFLGLSPTTYESGTSVRGRRTISRSGSPHIRALLYMGARSAKRYNKSCQALYQRLRTKGKCHKLAMIAVCHKLLRQVFAVIKSGRPFDNEYDPKLQKK